MIVGLFSETNACEAFADDPGFAPEAVQVHGAVQPAHQSLSQSRLPS